MKQLLLLLACVGILFGQVQPLPVTGAAFDRYNAILNSNFAYVAGLVVSGGVTSITVAGTTGQITVTGTCTVTTTGTCTFSLPSALTLPGTINKLTLTAPATGATLTILDGKAITVNKTLTLDGTDGVTITFPATSATVARTDAGQTFTGTQVFSSTITGSVSGNAATSTALAANGTNCSAGNYPLGIDAAGNVESCTAASTGTVSSVSVATANGISGTVANPTTTPAITLTSTLAGDVTGGSNANTVTKINGTALSGLATGIVKNTTTTGVPSIISPTNCSAGSYPLGIDSSGNSVSCTAAGAGAITPAAHNGAYAILGTDSGEALTNNSNSDSAWTIAQAGTSGFEAGRYWYITTYGGGTTTLTATTSVFYGQYQTTTALTLQGNTNTLIVSDGTNYLVAYGALPQIGTSPNTFDTWLGWKSGGLAHANTGGENVGIGYVPLSNITNGAANVAIGGGACTDCTTASRNVAVGRHTLRYNITGSDNVAVGEFTLETPNGVGGGGLNTALGSYALNASTASNNTAVGYKAMSTATTGAFNTAVGNEAMKNGAVTGAYNIALGYQALFGVTGGQYNVALGAAALNSNQTGNGNIGIGLQSLYANTVGSNIGIGYTAGNGTTTGGSNVFIGDSVAAGNITGANNTIIGSSANVATSALSNVTVMGHTASASASNTAVIGNSSVTDVYLGSTSGAAKLTAASSIFTAAVATVAAGQVGIGGTVTASSNCGTLATSAGCLVINVAGTTRYLPYY